MTAVTMNAVTMIAATRESQHRCHSTDVTAPMMQLLSLSPNFGGSLLKTKQLRKCAMTFLSLHTLEGAFRRHNYNCANAPRSFSLSTLRREHFYDQPLSPRFGGSISMTTNQPAHWFSIYLYLSIYLSLSIASQLSDTPRPSSFSKIRLILGGSVRQQSL